MKNNVSQTIHQEYIKRNKVYVDCFYYGFYIPHNKLYRYNLTSEEVENNNKRNNSVLIPDVELSSKKKLARKKKSYCNLQNLNNENSNNENSDSNILDIITTFIDKIKINNYIYDSFPNMFCKIKILEKLKLLNIYKFNYS